jgi:hypothetical protein
MTVNTADDLYELAKQLPVSERLRLVEKIAHDLSAAPPPAAAERTETRLVGEVIDIALEPARFTVKGARGLVLVRAPERLLDAVRAAWGCEVIVTVRAVLGAEGTVDDAEAIGIEVSARTGDPLSIFESTFGSGQEVWSTPEGQEHLETMRGSS